jgi:ketosteroid isomerase-like protein
MRRIHKSRAALFAVLMLVGCAANPVSGDSAGRVDSSAAKRQVADTERAFARTMAARDHKAFSSFLSQEAVFFSGDKPLRGAQQVADWWKRYYEGPDAPFSWEPEEVEVLDSGSLAISSGPVRDSKGALIATFTSIWRLEDTGKWRIIFDKGNRACPQKP